MSIATVLQKLRIKLFRLLSNNDYEGTPVISQPLLSIGLGKLIFYNNVNLGYWPSPFYFNGYNHLETRSVSSKIVFGANVFSNNNLTIICDKTSVVIGDNVLIGTNVEIYDSDFHGIHPDNRINGNYKCAPVVIKNNVFIGSNVRIMKGVTIGENSILANSSVVVKDIPDNVIAGGNPAKIIKSVFI